MSAADWKERLANMGDLRSHDRLVLASRWGVPLAALKREMKALGYRYSRSTGLWERTGIPRDANGRLML